MTLLNKQMLAVVLLNISLYGCGGGDTTTPPPPTPPPTPPPPVIGWDQHVSDWLRQQQSWLQSIQCPSSDCDTVSLSFAEGKF